MIVNLYGPLAQQVAAREPHEAAALDEEELIVTAV